MIVSLTASRAHYAASVAPDSASPAFTSPLRQGRGLASALVTDRLLRGNSRRMMKPPAMPTTSIATAQAMAFLHTGLW